MSHRRRAALPAVFALLLAGTLAACGGDDPEVPEAEPSASPSAAKTPTKTKKDRPLVVRTGTCLAGDGLTRKQARREARRIGSRNVDALVGFPAYDEQVGCEEPHRIEVVALVSLPARLDERVDDYGDLLRTGSDVYQRVAGAVLRSCARTDPNLASAMDASELDVVFHPGLGDGFELSWRPVPFDAWQGGQRELACVFSQAEEGTVMAADFATTAFPTSARICLDRKSETVACDEPHVFERIAVVDASRAVAAGELPGGSAVGQDGFFRFTEAQFTRLDTGCEAFLQGIGKKYDDRLVGVTETVPSMWPDEDGRFRLFCSAASPVEVEPAAMAETSRSVVGQP